MFLNFAALGRLPLVDATAISFAAPLHRGLRGVVFRERVRIYRWCAVGVGLAGILVMLWPYLNLTQYTSGGEAAAAATSARSAAFSRPSPAPVR